MSTLVAGELERLVDDDERCEESWQRARRALDRASPRGGRKWRPDELPSVRDRPVTKFVDTNVLAYAHDASEHTRRPVAEARLEELWRSRSGILSTQVLSEFYVVATRKFDPPMLRRAAREVVHAYTAWPVVQVDSALIVAASALEESHRVSFWEALIIEAARRGGADRLMSEDLRAGRRIGGLVIENPFAP